jgi:NAD(P)H dehydrogenase (quinone)
VRFTLTELVMEIAGQSGRYVKYLDLPASDYRAALVGAGVPAVHAALLADGDLAAAKGAFLGFERDLERLIGRPATTLQQAVAAALAGCLQQRNPAAEAAATGRRMAYPQSGHPRYAM